MNHTKQYTKKVVSYISNSGNQRWSIIQADTSFFGAMAEGVIKAAESKVRIDEPLVFARH